MEKSNKTTKCLAVLKDRSTYDALRLVYEWVKTGHIDFLTFQEVLTQIHYTDLTFTK